MKKSIILCLAVLLGTYLILNYAGRNSAYIAERELWKINLLLKNASKDPNNMPKHVFTEILNRHDEFLVKYPDSRMVPFAYIISGRVYVLQRDYKAARKRFEEVIERYPRETPANIQAMAEIGRTYLLENDERNVIETYQRILKHYPLSELGLKIPVLIGEFYQKKNKIELQQQSFSRAAEHYEKLISENPDSLVEYYALKYLGQCYLALENWEKVVEVYGNLIVKYPYPKYFTIYESDQLIRMITTVSITKLKNYNAANKIFERFIRENPKHSFNETFYDMMNSFKVLKQEERN